MDKQYDEKLCADFPELFAGRNGDPRETLMCFGFECDNGWYPLIDALCRELMAPLRQVRKDIARCRELMTDDGPFHTPARLAELEAALAALPVPRAVQVKEKFGTLRFYADNLDERGQALVDLAETLSATTCETCGMTLGAMTYGLGWMRTLCPAHADEAYGEAAAEYRASGSAGLP